MNTGNYVVSLAEAQEDPCYSLDVLTKYDKDLVQQHFLLR